RNRPLAVQRLGERDGGHALADAVGTRKDQAGRNRPAGGGPGQKRKQRSMAGNRGKSHGIRGESYHGRIWDFALTAVRLLWLFLLLLLVLVVATPTEQPRPESPLLFLRLLDGSAAGCGLGRLVGRVAAGARRRRRWEGGLLGGHRRAHL